LICRLRAEKQAIIICAEARMQIPSELQQTDEGRRQEVHCGDKRDGRRKAEMFDSWSRLLLLRSSLERTVQQSSVDPISTTWQALSDLAF
jgi:hypothetical protein